MVKEKRKEEKEKEIGKKEEDKRAFGSSVH